MGRPRNPNRPTRDCTHEGAPHQHGTVQAFRADKCRCDACSDAKSAYDKEQHEIREPLVSAEQSRMHLASLTQAGLSRRTIAAASGIAHSSLAHIEDGRTTQVRSGTERAILSVTVAELVASGLVTRRLVRV